MGFCDNNDVRTSLFNRDRGVVREKNKTTGCLVISFFPTGGNNVRRFRIFIQEKNFYEYICKFFFTKIHKIEGWFLKMIRFANSQILRDSVSQ